MTDRIEFTPDYGPKENSNIIKVIGVGGGGSNAVKHMYSEGIVGVDFLVCNTDQGHLNKSPIPDQLLLGKGLGAGADPEVARQFAADSKEKIKEFIGNETKMLFITAGMGKGTGTGASPVIAEVAHEMGILTIGVVTTPFRFEGKNRQKLANNGIEEMSKHVDSLIVVKNENIIKLFQDLDINKAYGQADDVLKNAVKCIAELITVDYTQNVDFNDIKTIMKDSGKAMLGLSIASGENRVEKVVDDALRCPLLDDSEISEAQNFLFFVSYGPDCPIKMSELGILTERFDDLQSENATVIWGQGEDPTLGDALKLSVIVTNFKGKDIANKIEETSKASQPAESNPTSTNSNIQIQDREINIAASAQASAINMIEERPVEETIKHHLVSNDDTAIFNTTQEIGVRITAETHNDSVMNTPLTTKPAQPVATNVYDLTDNIVQPQTPSYNSSNNPFQGYSRGPVKVSDANDRFSDPEYFRRLTEQPAIDRMQALREANNVNAQAAVTTTVENNHNFFEEANDSGRFFIELAD